MRFIGSQSSLGLVKCCFTMVEVKILGFEHLACYCSLRAAVQPINMCIRKLFWIFANQYRSEMDVLH